MGQSILEDDLAGPDNHHFLAHLSHLGQNVGREHDGMRAGQFFDQGSNLDDLLRVESDGRLVQDQHRRIMNNRLGQPDPLPKAFGQLAGQPVDDLGQPAAGDGGVERLADLGLA